MDTLKTLQSMTAAPKSPALEITPSQEPVGPRLKLRPIGLAILLDVPPEDLSDTTLGGIHVPEDVRRRMKRQMNNVKVVSVEAVGHEVRTVKAGDRVVVDLTTIDPTVLDGHHYWITSPAVVKGVVE